MDIIHELSNQIINQLNGNEQILSFIFSNDDSGIENATIVKKGNGDDISINLAGLILSGINSEDAEIRKQTLGALDILENALLTVMMEDPIIYKRITNHIMAAKSLCNTKAAPDTPMA